MRSSTPPEGFRYQVEVLPPNQEQELVARIQELPLKEFEFHGYTGKRRVISFGWHYSFEQSRLQPTEEIPAFLHKIRARGDLRGPEAGGSASLADH